MKLQLSVNNRTHLLEVDEQMPLLWVLRDELGLHGTKYGCGIGQCGACTVLIEGVAVKSCAIAAAGVRGNVTTIEGVGSPANPHPVQQAWIDQQVAQCGYCQPGQVMTAIALLSQQDSPSDTDIDQEFANNLCRCATYRRIRQAVKAAAITLQQGHGDAQ